jgi:predicted amidohydrolase
MRDLNVTIIQTELAWEDPKANYNHFDELLNAIDVDTDLVVLPEMFTTGFSMNAKSLYDNSEGESLNWLKTHAKQKQAAITGSIIAKEGANYYNRLYFVKPDGSFQTYDKKHLFTLAGEHQHYTAGTEKLIVDYKGWKICPLICYDLRFPVWARNIEDYDLLIYVANWPQKRVAAWDALLKARAVENMSYCVGVNRVGQDGNDFPYVGHSAVYDALGEKITTDLFEEAFVETVTLSKEHIIETREKLGFLKDRDAFKIQAD